MGIPDDLATSCPRCLSNLVRGSMGELTAHGCPRCGGIWLDTRQAWTVADGLDDDTLAQLRAHSKSARLEVDEGLSNLSCPTCHGTLRRLHVPRANLDVDICDEHGTWYDRGELEHIAAVIEAAPRAGEQPARIVHGKVQGGGLYIQQFEGLLSTLYEVRVRSLASAETWMRRTSHYYKRPPS